MTKPDGVKRYSPISVRGMTVMANPDDGGDWVRHEDYDRLAEEVGRLRALLTEAAPLLTPDYPCRCEQCQKPIRLKARIDQALTKGDCDE